MVFKGAFADAKELTNIQIETAKQIVDQQFKGEITNSNLVVAVAQLLATNYQSIVLDTSE